MLASKRAEVVYGPQVWVGKVGDVLEDGPDSVLVWFAPGPEHGSYGFRVNFPRAALKVEDVPIEA